MPAAAHLRAARLFRTQAGPAGGRFAVEVGPHQGGAVGESVTVAAVRMATVPADGPTGTFSDDQGSVPW
ncbi:hypothetical protein ACF1G3_37545 [Streptomyces rochei]|uniref:hypothetical protein n=1 Tax=Streptomyces rochei TaxID=1928 RepID=UPI0036F4C54C